MDDDDFLANPAWELIRDWLRPPRGANVKLPPEVPTTTQDRA